MNFSTDPRIMYWLLTPSDLDLRSYFVEKSVYDVCWSPFDSTLFACVSEGQIEIWNMEYSMWVWAETADGAIDIIAMIEPACVEILVQHIHT